MLRAASLTSSLVDTLHIALDVTANGRLPLPPYPENNPSAIHNITIFLYSYTTGRNFTVTNGTWPPINGSGNTGDIMRQEAGSTVKHINWMWPDCLVGNGQPSTLSDARGVYNVSERGGLCFALHEGPESNIILRSLSGKTFASTALTTTPSSTCPSPSLTQLQRLQSARLATKSATI